MKDAVVDDLLGQIYARPAQFDFYLVLADRYEELGEDDRAAFWRENAAQQRCCHWWHYYQIVMNDDTGKSNNPPYGWGCKERLGTRGGRWDKRIPNSMVPTVLFDLLPHGSESNPWWQTETAEACWEALLAAWKSGPRSRGQDAPKQKGTRSSGKRRTRKRP